MFSIFLGCGKRLKAAQEELSKAKSQLRIADVMFDLAQPIMVTDAKARILRANKAFCALMGYELEEMLGKTPRMFRSHHHDQAFYDQMVQTIGSQGHWEGEVWDRRKNGEVFPKWMSITAVTDDKGQVTRMMACYTDLKTQYQKEKQIHELAFYDVLTGLPNRALLHENLRQAQATAERAQHWGALLLLDWDDFKSINDSLGHSHGDQLLKLIGERISSCLPEGAVVGRLGGDEFALILPDLGDSQAAAAMQVETLAEQLQLLLAKSFTVADTDYQGAASLGLVLFSDLSQDASELFKQAELAMYQAKELGRGLHHFFDEALERQLAERMELERALRVAIDKGGLVLHFQPQIELYQEAFRITGAEALVRWQHPERGLISPGLFIPLAEETGLIQPLGDWVLEAACQQLGSWAAEERFAGFDLAVNVSASQFLQPDFANRVLTLLDSQGVAPQRLKLELTESLLVEDAEQVVATMMHLRSYGIRFSLDDFGTGYSSLQYLKRLPLHQLKIDQSFVSDIEHDSSARSIAKAVIALAGGLDLAVIAEGVESRTQQRCLATLGCHYYQGYWFSRPLPLAEFEAFCAKPVVEGE